ncbi:MAG: pseudouridine synthase [Candidatus Azobacteroides sp.]|nr:pseudouridine synthase [Candidatus Azobacteroides sp.]
MEQENNYRRRKSEDGYSDANRSENHYSGNRINRENNTGSNNFNNREGGRPFNRDSRNYNQGNRPYNRDNAGNSYERRPYNRDNRDNRDGGWNNNSGYRNDNRNYEGGNYERNSFGGGRSYNNRNNNDGNYNRNTGRDYNRDGNYGQRPNRPNYDRDGSGYQSGSRFGERQESRSSSFSQSGGERKKRPRIGERIVPGGNNRGGQFSPSGNNFSARRPGGQGNQGRKRIDPNAKYSQKKQLEYRETVTDPTVPLRLNKYLANAGVCSRREADEYIQAGVVSVNGDVVTELGKKVFRNDKIMFHNQLVTLEKKAYVLLNKPKNCVTTSDDPQERMTVMDLVKGACNERIYPIGRLDRNTTGVLLLTNDGELASKLTHPKFVKKKIYHVILDKPLTKADMQQIADGIDLDDEKVHADAISYAKEEDKREVGIELHIGKNRIVRRIFDQLDYKVIKLDRVYFAGLTKKNLPRGKWRYLSQREVDMLKMGAFE